MNTHTLAARIAGTLAALARLDALDTFPPATVYAIHRSNLRRWTNMLPSGSGFDAGTTIDRDKSTTEKLVLQTSFHHMTEHGFYDGWTDHTVTVRASLVYGLDVQVSGRDRNGIKEYITEIFAQCLAQEVES